MVSIIIPTRNRQASLERCLSSIRNNTKIDYEIIICDAGSEPAVIDDRTNISHHLHLPDSPSYAYSLNRGLEKAQGDYLTIPGIADDIEVTPGWLDQAVDCLKADPMVGMAVFGVREAAGFIVYGGYILNKEDYNYSHQIEPEYAGYGLVPRKVYQQLGGLDENFVPIYLEDADYGLRIQRANYHLQPVKGSLIIHHHEQSGRVDHAKANWFYFNKKWRPVL